MFALIFKGKKLKDVVLDTFPIFTNLAFFLGANKNLLPLYAMPGKMVKKLIKCKGHT